MLRRRERAWGPGGRKDRDGAVLTGPRRLPSRRDYELDPRAEKQSVQSLGSTLAGEEALGLAVQGCGGGGPGCSLLVWGRGRS